MEERKFTSIGRSINNRAVNVNNDAETKTELTNNHVLSARWITSRSITHPFAVPLESAPEAVVVAIFMIGAITPVIRLKLLASASPVPRCGAGKTYRVIIMSDERGFGLNLTNLGCVCV